MKKKSKRLVSLLIIATFVFISLFGSVAMAEKGNLNGNGGKSNDNGIRLRTRDCDNDCINNYDCICNCDCDCQDICDCDCDCDQLKYQLRKQFGKDDEEQFEAIIADLKKKFIEISDNGIRLRTRDCDNDCINNYDCICDCDCQNICDCDCDCDQLQYKLREQFGQIVEEQLEAIIADLEKQLKEANENRETERVKNLNKELERIKNRKEIGKYIEEELEELVSDLEEQIQEASENGETERVKNLNKELERIRNRIQWLKDQKENGCGQIYQNQFWYQFMFSIGNYEEEQE